MGSGVYVQTPSPPCCLPLPGLAHTFHWTVSALRVVMSYRILKHFQAFWSPKAICSIPHLFSLHLFPALSPPQWVPKFKRLGAWVAFCDGWPQSACAATTGWAPHVVAAGSAPTSPWGPVSTSPSHPCKFPKRQDQDLRRDAYPNVQLPQV